MRTRLRGRGRERTRHRAWLPLLLALAGCGGDGGPAGPPAGPPRQPCTSADARCLETLLLPGGGRLPVYRTEPLAGDTAVTRAVIVVHGVDRNADDYFETMVHAARDAGALATTLVIAPHFQTADDGAAADEPVWTEGGWKRGDLSIAGSGGVARISSYTALDALLGLLDDRLRFPRLAAVGVTGHSAGGQLTHRFAAGSPVEPGVSFRLRYIAANPSTWLYPGPERDVNGSWTVPDTVACPDWDDWHLGLQSPNTYMSHQPTEAIRSRLLGRDVVLLVGTADTGSEDLDVSCGAMLQGPNRYRRGLTFLAGLDALHPGHHHRLYELAGVGHSAREVYSSATARALLFEW